MNDVNREIMLITQEECAEVTQAISKVFRFGLEDHHKGVTNQEHLEEEIGDLMCMIDLMLERGVVREAPVLKAKSLKLAKLQQWSNIFGEKK